MPPIICVRGICVRGIFVRGIFVLGVLGACGNDTGIGSNPPDATVPAGDGVSEIDPWALTWTEVTLGYSFSLDIVIESLGEGDLQVYEVKVLADPDDAFFFEPEIDESDEVELIPGESVTYTVTTDLDESHTLDAPSEGQLRIRTNDPACGTAIIPLTSYPEGYTGTIDTTEAASPCQ